MQKQFFEVATAVALLVVLVIVFLFATQRDYLKTATISLSLFLTTVALTQKKTFRNLMNWRSTFLSTFGIVFLIGTSAFIYWSETNLWSFQRVSTEFPDIGFGAQLYLWFSFTHFLSYIAHGLLLVYLWYRWKRLVPALIVTFLEIALSEFSFVGAQWYQFGFIFTWWLNWYPRFVVISFPFISSHGYFDLKDKRMWLFFGVGIFFVFLNGFFGFRDPNTWDYEAKDFRFFRELIYEPTAWYNMYINRIGKILMALAFVFVKLKSEEKATIETYTERQI